MATGFRKWRSKTRARRCKNSFAVSSFTIFLIGFVICYLLLYLQSITAHQACRDAAIWLSGWFTFSSLLQMIGMVIVLSICVWVIRIVTFSGLNIVETGMQGILIIAVVIAFVAHKSYLLPFGEPSHVQMSKLIGFVWPMRLALEEEIGSIQHETEWRYDYPPPPEIEFKVRPSLQDSYDKSTAEIFKKKASPLRSEMVELETCYTEWDRARTQYRKDKETLRQYWKGFRNWYAVHKDEYEQDNTVDN